MSKPPFQPAPRPRPRTSPEEADRLANAAGDLGFTRVSTPPDRDEATDGPRGQMPKGAVASAEVSLKVMVPRALAITLRQEAAVKGVTVRYLILAALAAQGYDIDMSQIPEDGRRVR
ncbi:hypothetical protein SAMN05192565_1158 [Methylobacterium gossipiicola]|uniref:Uncharacterized protein n=2 Tax=Methylobacterium gossipiicola TaxID=582675 RepID=A0A1I2VG51_9HYPH|nr:hypothetical protein SAMN05192565_1158 [Methylobacterium gossipiicola]